jgi:hypothetical protein
VRPRMRNALQRNARPVLPESRKANWLAVFWVTAVAAFLLYGPVYSSRSSTVVHTPGREPQASTSTGSAGLAAVEGKMAYVRMLGPIAVALVPLFLARSSARRVASGVAAALIGLYALLGMMTIGIFYAPAVLALAFAARGTPRGAIDTQSRSQP